MSGKKLAKLFKLCQIHGKLSLLQLITMNQNSHFTGQPVFSQLIKLIPRDIVASSVQKHKSDRYSKRFTTWHHLCSMLFACYGRCQSLREVVSGMKALEGKLHYSDIRVFTTRSTFSDANTRRTNDVFESIYYKLKEYWNTRIPDSRKKSERLYFVDSTVIKLFQEIFKNAGQSGKDGRRKGGVKVHMAVEDADLGPHIVHISAGAENDKTFMPKVILPPHITVIMDRGYCDYRQYNRWDKEKIRWITRIYPTSVYKVNECLEITSDQAKLGLLKVQTIELGYSNRRVKNVLCRKIDYLHPESGKMFEFITNDLTTDPLLIAGLYKKRWSIELLFKRLKQNMPLQYFLGESQNAIRIQIWCALIADLLIQVLQRHVKRRWAFSNVVSLIRLHLFNYLSLHSFLENPDKYAAKKRVKPLQLKINLSG